MSLVSFQVEVLYEDDDLMACNKPAGIVTHGTLDPKRENFYDYVRARFSPEAAKELALHHRLDAQTSGVLIFSKSKRMNRPLQELFRNHQIQKTYVAITHLNDKHFLSTDTFQIKNFLRQSSEKPSKAVAVKSGGKPAMTDFKILFRTAQYWVVQARPLTGRTHQIRTHLAEAGIPLIADELYGGRAQSDIEHFLLHARGLQLRHPIAETQILIEAPYPKTFTRLLGPELVDLSVR